MRPQKFNFNTFRKVIENCIGVQKCNHTKKQLKRAFLAFFGDISGENLNKTVIIAQTSFPCYETKSFVKKIVLWNFAKLTLATSFTS